MARLSIPPAMAAGRSRRRFGAWSAASPCAVDYAGRTDHQIALAMLDGEREHLPRVLEELAGALEARKEAMRLDGHAYPGVAEVLESLHARDDVVQSLLTGNIETNAALKVSAFGLERWLDFEVGAYGSDPHERRSDLVAVARERAAEQVRRADRRGAGGRHAAGRARSARGGGAGRGRDDRLLPTARRCASLAPKRCSRTSATLPPRVAAITAT